MTTYRHTQPPLVELRYNASTPVGGTDHAFKHNTIAIPTKPDPPHSGRWRQPKEDAPDNIELANVATVPEVDEEEEGQQSDRVLVPNKD
jgi:hypothetical protein